MKTKKNIEYFTRYVIKESSIEKPSVDFVGKVMNRIDLERIPIYENKYKPLISKLGWIIISIVLILSSIYFWSKKFSSSNYLSELNLSFSTNLSLTKIFNEINIPSTFTFVFLFFTILVVIQLLIIKKYFDKAIFKKYA
ncbi:MAG: hypothetical protein R3342_01980 [Lutibacter sp.]|uniref:hypothetical protein n=1 Tax=Lutibacter sp. TaxID=1925666 RepID=UPI00299DF226|nr:hypothetical protein [Lutibacter sp.]MDX1828292.1 hypothetical protein [Lutibacter sp.]